MSAKLDCLIADTSVISLLTILLIICRALLEDIDEMLFQLYRFARVSSRLFEVFEEGEVISLMFIISILRSHFLNILSCHLLLILSSRARR
jgi:hypothetical protein